MKLIKITKDLYVNIDHISEIGRVCRTDGIWFIKILSDNDKLYVSKEEAMEIIREISSIKQ